MALEPQIDPTVAANLHAVIMEGSGVARASIPRFLLDYHQQIFSDMMRSPDDKLPGFRGMLLAIDHIAEALQEPNLRASANRKAKK